MLFNLNAFRAQLRPLKYVKRLLSFAFAEFPLFGLSLLIGLFSSGIELVAMAMLFPLSMIVSGAGLSETSRLYGYIEAIGLTPSPLLFISLFLGFFLLRIMTHLISQGLYLYYARCVHHALSTSAFEAVLKRFSLRDIEQKTIGHYVSMANEEAPRAGMLMMLMCQFFNLLGLSLLYFIAIVYYSPSAAIIVVSYLLFVFIVMRPVFKKLYRMGSDQIGFNREATSCLMDGMNGLRSIRAFRSEDYVTQAYSKVQHKYTMAWFWVDFMLQVAKSAPVLIILFMGLVLILSKVFVIESGAQLASVITILLFLVRFFPSLGQSFNIFLKVIADAKAGTDITGMLDVIATDKPGSKASEMIGPLNEVHCHDLSFSYEAGCPVLNKQNWHFEKGHVYALTGPSGAGKSTLADCLLQFYPLDSGVILLNDKPIDDYSVEAIRRSMLLLGQQVAILNDTVLNNITFGVPASIEDVKRVCACVELDELILSMPQGYDTILQYQGSNLSGGQKQRIGLARALLRDPSLLILDESTSALDKDGQERIMKRIIDLYREKILILITHDPILMGLSDRVVTINPGSAVETDSN